jgi:hypothetical protein
MWLDAVFSFGMTEMEIATQSDVGQQFNARLMKAYACVNSKLGYNVRRETSSPLSTKRQALTLETYKLPLRASLTISSPKQREVES